MARTASVYKANELHRKMDNARARLKEKYGSGGRKSRKKAREEGMSLNVFVARVHNRCRRCGRGRGYLRKFELCRICFRSLALEGHIPGVTKSSW
jgi:small subunit ribosomal protein S14